MANEDDVTLKVSADGASEAAEQIDGLARNTERVGKVSAQAATQGATALKGMAREAENLGDKLTRALQSPVAAVQEVSRSFISRFGLMGVAAAGVIGGVTSLSAAILALGSRGAQMRGVEEGFETMAGSAGRANEILQALRSSTVGTVDDMKLMTEANGLMSVGFQGTAAQWKTLGESARVLARQGFGSVEQVMGQLNRAMETGMTRRLAMMGITVDAQQAEYEYARAHGVAVNEMTRAQRLEATRGALLDAFNKKIAESGTLNLSLAERIAQTTNQISNFGEEIMKRVADSQAVANAFDAIKSAFMAAFGKDSQSAVEVIVGWIEKFANMVRDYGPTVIQALRDIWDWISRSVAAVRAAWDAIPDWLKEIGKEAAIAVAAGWALDKAFSAAAKSITAASGGSGGGGGLFDTFAGLATMMSGSRDLVYSLGEVFGKVGPAISRYVGGWTAAFRVFAAQIASVGFIQTIGVWITQLAAAAAAFAWPIAAAVALGAAIYGIYKYWDQLKSIALSVVDTIAGALQWFSETKLGQIISLELQIIQGFLRIGAIVAKAFAVGAVNTFLGGLRLVWELLKLVWAMAKDIGQLFVWGWQKAGEAFNKHLGDPLQKFINGLKWVLDKLPKTNPPREPEKDKLPTVNRPTAFQPPSTQFPVPTGPTGNERVGLNVNNDGSEQAVAFKKAVDALIDSFEGESRAARVASAAIDQYIATHRKAIAAGTEDVGSRERVIAAIEKELTARRTLSTAAQAYYDNAIKSIRVERDLQVEELKRRGITQNYLALQRQMGQSDEQIARGLGVKTDALKIYESGMQKFAALMEKVESTELQMYEARFAAREKTTDDILESIRREEAARLQQLEREAENTNEYENIEIQRWLVTQEFELKRTALVQQEAEKRRKAAIEESERQLSGTDLAVAQLENQRNEEVRRITPDAATYAQMSEERKRLLEQETRQIYDHYQERIDLARGTSQDIIAVLKDQGIETQRELDQQARAARSRYELIKASGKAGWQGVMEAFNRYAAAEKAANKGSMPVAVLREQIGLMKDKLKWLKDEVDAGRATTEEYEKQKEEIDQLEQSLRKHPPILETMQSIIGASADAWARIGQVAGGSLGRVATLIGQVTAGLAKMVDHAKAITKALGTENPIDDIIAIAAAAADGIALLYDAFTKSPGEDVATRVAQNWGTEIGEKMGDQIAAVAAKRFAGDRQAAEIFSFSQILEEAGGLTERNVATFAARFNDIFSMFDTGKFSVQQMTEVIRENIEAFVDLARTGNARAFVSVIDASDELIERLRQGRINAIEFQDAINPILDGMAELGETSSVAFDAYMREATRVIDQFKQGRLSAEQVNQTLSDGIGRLATAATKNGGIVTQSFLDMAKAAREAGLEIDSLSAFFDQQFDKMAAGLEKAVGKLPDPQKLIDEFAKKNKLDASKVTFREAAGLGDPRAWAQAQAEWQQGFDRLSRIALASFNTMVQNGKSPLEAVMAIGESIDRLAAFYEKAGVRGNSAFAQLSRLRQLTNDNRDLIESVSGLNDVFVALANTGGLTQETMDDMMREGVDSFNKLKAAGFSQNESLAQMVPYLQSVVKAHKERGLAISEETQAMIDQAREQGLLQEEQMSTVDVLKDGLSEIIRLLGGEIPEAWRKAAQAASDASGDQSEGQADVEQAAMDAHQQIRDQQAAWEEARIAAEKANRDTKGGIDTTEGGLSDLAKTLDDHSPWYRWRDAAVEAAEEVYEAVHAVSYGHSPGGIKDIVAHLYTAMEASRDFQRQLTDSMSLAKDAVDSVKPAADWGAMSMRIGGGIQVPPPSQVSLRMPAGKDAGSPSVVQLNVDGRKWAEATVDLIEASSTPYARLRTMVKQMVK